MRAIRDMLVRKKIHGDNDNEADDTMQSALQQEAPLLYLSCKAHAGKTFKNLLHRRKHKNEA
jgi:hypothetical protein